MMKTAIASHPGLPNFLCVGVEKCGTTSLYALLKQHPDIGLSRYKETQFFNTYWDKGLEWYQEKFSHIPASCHTIGEITPAYHRFPEVIPRIKQVLGEKVKIIILLREPRRRAFSHYIHDFANHLEVTDLVYKRYLTTTLYTPILRQYFSAFGKENCLVQIFEEDFLPTQQKLVDHVCDFLTIPHHTISPIHSNPSCLPVACWSPAYNSTLTIEGKSLAVPANSLVIYTENAKNTRVLPQINKSDGQKMIDHIRKAVSFIPALKSSIIFDQNVRKDLEQVEMLLDRKLDVWRQPLVDMQARFAALPNFTSCQPLSE
jgi:hypothetical protein